MEKLMQRENVSVGYGQLNSPKSPCSDDMDFNDVFGGPPKRFSMQEVRVRYSFGETVEEDIRGSSPWGSLKEKPVFGEESSGPRRRHQGDDFFDDIFRGGVESYSSPRRSDNMIGSNPGSRIMSPARPLPPASEPFATSLPAPFSLPAKLTKAMELPTFGSHNHGQHKTDGTTNALNSPHSSSSLSRFSNQGIKGQDKIRNEVHPFHRQSPLSRQASLSSQDSPLTVKYDQKDDIDNMEKDKRNVDSFGNQFHFSIYKWAGRSVPMLMPLVVGNSLKSKGNISFDRSASSNGRIERKKSAVEPESVKMEFEKDDLWSKKMTQERQSSIQEALYEIPESKSLRSIDDSVVYDGARQNIKEEQVKLLDESDIGEKIKKTVPVKIEESLESEPKPLRVLLTDDIEQSGKFTEMKKSKTKTPKGVHANAHDTKNVKKNDGKRTDSKSATVEKSSFEGAATNSGVSPGKSAVNRKVREFVQIFNQEADSKPKADFPRRSQSSRWTNFGLDQKENEVNSNEDKKPDVPLKVDENLNNDEAQQYPPKTTPSYTSNHFSTNPKTAFSSETLLKDSKISVEISDDPLEDNFMVQELSDDHENVTQSESSEDVKAIDAKIRQWSVGKKGNIRSLLSTLQCVLWAESGWKPVPLVDLIESNSVKKAYQKALLRLHPDKLQQKGAAFHHKYIAEKVFDILQEAWDDFNTCSSLNL